MSVRLLHERLNEFDRHAAVGTGTRGNRARGVAIRSQTTNPPTALPLVRAWLVRTPPRRMGSSAPRRESADQPFHSRPFVMAERPCMGALIAWVVLSGDRPGREFAVRGCVL